MSRLKFYLTLLLARLVSLAIKVLNRSSGTSFVGLMILKYFSTKKERSQANSNIKQKIVKNILTEKLLL